MPALMVPSQWLLVLGVSSYTTSSSAPKMDAARASWPATAAAASWEGTLSRMDPGTAMLRVVDFLCRAAAGERGVLTGGVLLAAFAGVCCGCLAWLGVGAGLGECCLFLVLVVLGVCCCCGMGSSLSELLSEREEEEEVEAAGCAYWTCWGCCVRCCC